MFVLCGLLESERASNSADVVWVADEREYLSLGLDTWSLGDRRNSLNDAKTGPRSSAAALKLPG